MHATRHLTERRAADRAAMADDLQQLAESMGAKAIRPEPYAPRQVRLEIEVPGGAYLPLCFEGDNGRYSDMHVPTWNVRTSSLYAFADAMGDVNPYHFAKASRGADGYDALRAVVARDLAILLSGRGYSAERALMKAHDRLDRLNSIRNHLAPLVAEGIGTTWADGTEHESPAEVRHDYETRLPEAIARLEAFIADGAPLDRCDGHAFI